MPLLLIAAAWIAILALFVAVCQTAARGDQQPAPVLDAGELSAALSPRPVQHTTDPVRVTGPLGLPLRHGGRTRSKRLAHVAR